ncbi:MAG: STAS/SEC14 domain-containing protein [Marinoscillum sp.]
MIEQIELGNGDVLGFKITGHLDKESFDYLYGLLEKRLQQPGHFNLYLEIPMLEGIDFEVMGESIKQTFKDLVTYLFKVDKIAIVTNESWLKYTVKIENALIPGIEEKVFADSDKAAALIWLAEPVVSG